MKYQPAWLYTQHIGTTSQCSSYDKKKSPLSLFHDLKKFASHIPAIFPPINVNR